MDPLKIILRPQLSHPTSHHVGSALPACPARTPERPPDLQEATINRTMDRSMVGECLGRVIVGQGVSLVAAEVVTVAELCAKAHLPPQLVSDRRDAGAQPYPPDAFATGARAPGPNFPILEETHRYEHQITPGEAAR